MRRFFILALATLPLLAPESSAAESEVWLGVEQYSGTYGGPDEFRETDVYVNPIWQFGRTQLSLYLPFVRIDSPGSAAVPAGPGGRLVVTAGTGSTETGLGDVTSTLRQQFWSSPDGSWALAEGGVKLPTATNPQLSTGEPDYWLGLELGAAVGKGSVGIEVAHTVYGDPPGYELRDADSAYLWADRYGPSVYLGLSLYAEQALQPGTEGAREAGLYLRTDVAGRGIWMYLTRGFSTGSADWGIGVAIEAF